MTKSKNPAALKLAALSRKKRMRTLTKEQRSEQARRAVNSRKDRQKPERWYGLILFPADWDWSSKHVAKNLDRMHADPARYLVACAKDKAELYALAEKKYRDQGTDVIELDWNPHQFRLVREYKPDTNAQLKAMRAVLGGES